MLGAAAAGPRLSLHTDLPITTSTQSDGPEQISWPPPVGVPQRRRAHTSLFSCCATAKLSSELLAKSSSLAEQKPSSRRVRVILVVLSERAVRARGAFSRRWRVRSEPGKRQPAGSRFQIPEGAYAVHESDVTVPVCPCVQAFFNFILSYSKGFASPRQELLHNIDPLYTDLAPCKFLLPSGINMYSHCLNESGGLCLKIHKSQNINKAIIFLCCFYFFEDWGNSWC